VNPLRGQNNVQGAAQMGCDPGILTGSVALNDRRGLFERVWGAPVPRDHGLNLMAMMDAAAAGRLKALWVIGYDILATLADMDSTRAALGKVDLVIVQDLFMTKTASAAGHLFLPAASNFEKDGTFMNGERRIQRVRKAVDAPGDAKPDWWIISALARRMGHGAAFTYQSAEDIWNEIRLVWPEAAGVSYARLEHGGLQWPCRAVDDPGTSTLHVSDFSRPGRAALQRLDYVATPEQVSDEFPLLLSTGRNLFQFNAGTMTMRTRNTKLRRTDTLDISPEDALRLEVKSNGRVRVRSRYGAVVMEARITNSVSPGTVFATFHDSRVGLNKITSPLRDRIVQAPEYKVTAVAVDLA
jgi:formate dehydrogenase major subunit